MKNDIPKTRDHHGRNLLWSPDETETRNSTSNFSPFTMCPASINQTESARLVLELERLVQLFVFLFKDLVYFICVIDGLENLPMFLVKLISTKMLQQK